MDKIQVQVVFTEDGFTDALYFSQEAFANLDPKELSALKQARIDNWKKLISQPAIVAEPTVEDISKEQASIDEQITSLEARKVELSSRIMEMKPIEISPIKEELIKG